MPPEESTLCYCIHCRAELAPGKDICEHCSSEAGLPYATPAPLPTSIDLSSSAEPIQLEYKEDNADSRGTIYRPAEAENPVEAKYKENEADEWDENAPTVKRAVVLPQKPSEQNNETAVQSLSRGTIDRLAGSSQPTINRHRGAIYKGWMSPSLPVAANPRSIAVQALLIETGCFRLHSQKLPSTLPLLHKNAHPVGTRFIASVAASHAVGAQLIGPSLPEAPSALPETPLPPTLEPTAIPITYPTMPHSLYRGTIDRSEEDALRSSTPVPPTVNPITPLPPIIDPITPLPLVSEPTTEPEHVEQTTRLPSRRANHAFTQAVIISPAYDDVAQKQASFLSRARAIVAHVPVWVLIALAGLVTMLVQGYRLGVAPDIFSDEGVYFLVAANIAQGHGLIVDHSAFFWHPPAYMLIEAIYLKFVGLAYANPLTGVLAARYLNIFFAGCTTVALILFGRKLHSYKAGFVIAAFFLLDPYVQRINRRNMLETLAMLCILLGLYFFFTTHARNTHWQRLGAGIAFGVALLVKEAMVLELLVPVLYVVWCKRSQVRDLFWVIGTAFAIYLLYPLWSLVVGEWNDYLSYKSFGIDRVLVRLQSAQATPTSSTITLVGSKGSLFDAILARLAQYGMSYVLIALAAMLAIVLAVRFRHVESAQYLAVWNIFSIGFGFVLGGVSDQYFYYLIVSSICVAGYIVILLLDGNSSTYAKNMLLDRSYWGQRFSSVYLFLFRMLWRPLIAVFILMLLVNSATWTRTYALGTDDAYMSIVTYIKAHFPRGETIEASDDVAYYYLSPSYTIRLDRDPTTIENLHARYFILSSKDAQGGYDAMTPQLYNWVIQNSHPLLVQNDLSFAQIGLYQLNTVRVGQEMCPGISAMRLPGQNMHQPLARKVIHL